MLIYDAWRDTDFGLATVAGRWPGRSWSGTGILPGKGFSRQETPERRVQFGDLRIIGIEQNPATTSRWAASAREGNRIMQFRCKGRYVANVCEGKLLRYPEWRALKLPD